MFVNEGGGDYRLSASSPCLNMGDNFWPLDDVYDLHQVAHLTDEDPNRRAPDLALAPRLIDNVDMGAYERQVNSTCTPDMMPLPDRNGIVNIDDLLAVINTWGACPGTPTFCPADIVASFGVVDIDDLLAVINGWGDCGDPDSLPESIEDCWDMAYQECGGEIEGECFETTYSSCIRYLCSEEIIECPEE